MEAVRPSPRPCGCRGLQDPAMLPAKQLAALQRQLAGNASGALITGPGDQASGCRQGPDSVPTPMMPTPVPGPVHVTQGNMLALEPGCQRCLSPGPEPSVDLSGGLQTCPGQQPGSSGSWVPNLPAPLFGVPTAAPGDGSAPHLLCGPVVQVVSCPHNLLGDPGGWSVPGGAGAHAPGLPAGVRLWPPSPDKTSVVEPGQTGPRPCLSLPLCFAFHSPGAKPGRGREMPAA